MELLCISSAGVDRTKGEMVHTPNLFFCFRSSVGEGVVFFSVCFSPFLFYFFLISGCDPRPSGGFRCCHI